MPHSPVAVMNVVNWSNLESMGRQISILVIDLSTGMCLSMQKREKQDFGGEIAMGMPSNLRGLASHLRCQTPLLLSSHEHISRSTVKTPPDLLLPLVRTSLGFSHECPGDRETLASSITLRCSIRDLGSRMTWRIPDVQWLLNQCQHLG